MASVFCFFARIFSLLIFHIFLLFFSCRASIPISACSFSLSSLKQPLFLYPMYYVFCRSRWSTNKQHQTKLTHSHVRHEFSAYVSLSETPMADLQSRSRLLCSCRVTHTTLAITYPFPPLMHMFFAPCIHLTKLQLVRHGLAIHTAIEQSRFVRSTSHGVVPAHDLRVHSVHAPSTARPAPPVDHAVSKERHAGRNTM